MSPYRYHDDDSSLGSVAAGLAIGALAGFAVGVAVAQQVGGISGIAARLRERFGALEDDELDEYEEDEYEDDEATELETRVLEAFRNDPVLAERPVDIGALGEGIIELSGWVESETEIEHATTIAGGVPGVETVVNRLSLGEDEMDEDMDETLDDPSEPLEGGRWEGNRIGTGRRRQGTSDEPTRHADPKPELEDRWLSEEQQIRDAAEDIDNIKASRKRGGKRTATGRADGSPAAPGGVPKADHVIDAEQAADERDMRAD